jgi:serine/threonine protein kinase
MKIASVSVRDVRGLDSVNQVVHRLEEEWQRGPADLRRLWSDLGPDRPASELTLMLKADLRCRFQRGERPKAADYLALFSELRSLPERMLSLIYEEYCLLEDQGERPDIGQFCERYEPWKDSLLSQLRYHSMFSQVVGAPPTPRFPELGEKFEHFALREELGRGGSARVYLANDETLGGRPVALKIYPDRGNEASIQGRLDHAHIIPVHSTPYQAETKLRGLCMHYQPGVPLDEVIRRVDPASKPRRAAALWHALTDQLESTSKESETATATVDDGSAATTEHDRPHGPGWQSFPTRGRYVDAAAWIVMRIAQALAHAHSRGVQHRDVKPANILLAFKEGPQLFDFNLAFDPNSPGQAEAALRGGTLPYMAPEQLQAFIDPARWSGVDPRADLYSLGFVLRELLTGEAPEIPAQSLKPGQAIRELLERRQGFRPNLRKTNPQIPHALEAITARCLAYDPDDRYASAIELAEDLQRFLARRPLLHAENPDRAERISNWAWRNRFALGASLVLVSSFAAYKSDEWIHTVEYQRPFSNAVAALDDGRLVEAVHVLKELAASNPKSPVILFYRAVGEGDLAYSPETAWANLRPVWDITGARDELLAWKRTHPMFVMHAGSLVNPLVESLDLDTSDWLPEHVQVLYKTVYESLNLIVSLDPTNIPARIGLASVHEKRKNYEEAERILAALIEELKNKTLDVDRGYLRRAMQTRARLETNWAGNLLKTPARQDRQLGEIEARLKLAMADLDRVVPLIEKGDENAPFQVNFVRCQANTELGEVVSRRGRQDEAIHYLGEANDLIEKMRGTRRYRQNVDDLETRINTLLRAEQSSRGQSTHPEKSSDS